MSDETLVRLKRWWMPMELRERDRKENDREKVVAAMRWGWWDDLSGGGRGRDILSRFNEPPSTVYAPYVPVFKNDPSMITLNFKAPPAHSNLTAQFVMELLERERARAALLRVMRWRQLMLLQERAVRRQQQLMALEYR
jgi:hypothetical protein